MRNSEVVRVHLGQEVEIVARGGGGGDGGDGAYLHVFDSLGGLWHFLSLPHKYTHYPTLGSTLPHMHMQGVAVDDTFMASFASAVENE
ncbi:hypothetical protein TcWFU_003206 [Taenia crassiceps]|uniref:Uncharacterized protein n=1 Tax=Taenia crassiceps TaxID=6207 RepID=A0ABR4Q1P3_9CEST